MFYINALGMAYLTTYQPVHVQNRFFLRSTNFPLGGSDVCFYSAVFQYHTVKKYKCRILKYYTCTTQLYLKNLSKESVKDRLGPNRYELSVILNIK